MAGGGDAVRPIVLRAVQNFHHIKINIARGGYRVGVDKAVIRRAGNRAMRIIGMTRHAHMVEKLLVTNQLGKIFRRFFAGQIQRFARMIKLRHRIIKMHMHIVQHAARAAVFMIGQAALMGMRLGRQRKKVHMPNAERRARRALRACHLSAGNGNHLVGNTHLLDQWIKVENRIMLSRDHNLAMFGNKSPHPFDG